MLLCAKWAIQEFNNTPMPNIYKLKSCLGLPVEGALVNVEIGHMAAGQIQWRGVVHIHVQIEDDTGMVSNDQNRSTQIKSKGHFREQKVPPLKYSACISFDKVTSSLCSLLELAHATFLIQLEILPCLRAFHSNF